MYNQYLHNAFFDLLFCWWRVPWSCLVACTAYDAATVYNIRTGAVEYGRTPDEAEPILTPVQAVPRLL